MEAFVNIRIADVGERAALEALQWRASLQNRGDRAALLANPDAIKLPSEQISAGHVFAAERNGAILGFAAVLPRADGDCELDALFVEPEFWRKGVGAALIGYCVRHARQRHAAILHVVGNPHAKAFYLACGFDSLGEVPTRFGPGLHMAKRL